MEGSPTLAREPSKEGGPDLKRGGEGEPASPTPCPPGPHLHPTQQARRPGPTRGLRAAGCGSGGTARSHDSAGGRRAGGPHVRAAPLPGFPARPPLTFPGSPARPDTSLLTEQRARTHRRSRVLALRHGRDAPATPSLDRD